MKKKLLIIIPAAIAVIAIIIAFLCIRFTPEETVTDVNSLMRTAQQYLVENNYEQAVLEFRKIIEIEPKNVEAYLGLAEAYEKSGDTEKAIEALEAGYRITGDERLKDKLDSLIPLEETTTSFIETSVTNEETTMTTKAESADENYIKIIDVRRVSSSDSNYSAFDVTVEYSLTSAQGEINVGFSVKDSDDHNYTIVESNYVDCGSSTVTIPVEIQNDIYNDKKCFVNLSEYPHESSWKPLSSDNYVIP